MRRGLLVWMVTLPPFRLCRQHVCAAGLVSSVYKGQYRGPGKPNRRFGDGGGGGMVIRSIELERKEGVGERGGGRTYLLVASRI